MTMFADLTPDQQIELALLIAARSDNETLISAAEGVRRRRHKGTARRLLTAAIMSGFDGADAALTNIMDHRTTFDEWRGWRVRCRNGTRMRLMHPALNGGRWGMGVRRKIVRMEAYREEDHGLCRYRGVPAALILTKIVRRGGLAGCSA